MPAFDSRVLDDLSRIGDRYSRLLKDYGDVPEAAQWPDRDAQERRMRVLAEVGDIGRAKILDFGCGTGHLLAFLDEYFSFTGEYVGYDLSAEMIRLASAKFPKARFARRNIFAEGIDEDFDYVLISGVFNDRLRDSGAVMKAILRALFAKTRRALAFNVLSSYAVDHDPRRFYASPEQIFSYCKEALSPLVALRHDYELRSGVPPAEFTVYVYRAAGAAANDPARKG